VRASLVALAQVVDMAVTDGTLPRNVVRGVKRPRISKSLGHDLQHWQPAELVKFRRHSDSDPLAGAWRLTLCGLTRADVLGLRWSDVDLTTGIVSVSQGRVPVGKGDHTDMPKSEQRRRSVPVEVIARQRRQRSGRRRQRSRDRCRSAFSRETLPFVRGTTKAPSRAEIREGAFV